MKKLLDPSLFALIKIMDLIGDGLKKGGGANAFLSSNLNGFGLGRVICMEYIGVRDFQLLWHF